MEYNSKKTAALIFELLQNTKGRSMDYRKVIKLLYFCDREMYLSKRTFITGDDYVSKSHGPVLVITQGLIQEEALSDECNDQFFHDHFKVEKHTISIRKDIADSTILTEREKRIAKQYANLFEELDWRQLSEVSHRVCREWKDPLAEKDYTTSATKISEESIRVALAQ